jgi:LPXTG-site transpeptidase (sortase) family protein
MSEPTSGPDPAPKDPKKRGVGEAAAASGSAGEGKAIPAWRRRMYRVPIFGAIFYVIWPPRTSHSVARRIISASLAIVAILGIGMAAYPWAGEKYPFFYKIPVEKLIEWSNFLSDMQTNRLQDELADRFEDLEVLGTKEGDPLTRFQVPKLGVDTIVVQGTSPSALRAGAGHYPKTPLPGQKGNVGIAGHRTTYGRPFNRIDQLVVGDKIILTTPIARYTYEVSKPPWTTHPFDWTIVGKSKDPLLTLTTCHPKGSANERLVVRAKLVKSEPLNKAA